MQIWFARSLHGSPQPAADVRGSMQPRSGKTLTTRRVMAAGDLPRIPLAPSPNPLLSGQMRYLWLHRFSGSPGSGKGPFLRERPTERGARLEIPDLNQPAFRDLTVTRM